MSRRSAFSFVALALSVAACDRLRGEAPLSSQLARHQGNGYTAELRCNVRPRTSHESGRNVPTPAGCDARTELFVHGGSELAVPVPTPASTAPDADCTRARAYCASLRGTVRARSLSDGAEALAAHVDGATAGRVIYVASGGLALFGPEPLPAANVDALLAATPPFDEAVRAQIVAQRLTRPAEHLERALAGPLFTRHAGELLTEAEGCRLPGGLVRELIARGPSDARERLFVSGVRDRACPVTVEAMGAGEGAFLRERLPRALVEHAPGVVDEQLGRLALAAWIAHAREAATALEGFARAMPAASAPNEVRAAWVTAAFALAGTEPERASAVAIEVLPRLEGADELAGLPRREVPAPNPRLWGFESSRARALAAMLTSGATQPVRDGLAALAANAGVSRAPRQVAVVVLAAVRDPRATLLATPELLTQRQLMIVTGRGAQRPGGPQSEPPRPSAR